MDDFINLAIYLRELRVLFRLGDKDRSTNLDIKELKTVLAGLAIRKKKNELRQILSKYDQSPLDHVKGRLNFAEFVTIVLDEKVPHFSP